MKTKSIRGALAALAAAAVVAVSPDALAAQFREPPVPAAYAVRNATVVRPGGSRLENVTLVVRGRFIETIGPHVTVPPDAKLLEGDSLWVYPGLVDAAGEAEVEFPEVEREEARPWTAPRDVQGFQPSRRVVTHLKATGASTAAQRKKGVVAAAVHPEGALMPGQSALLLFRGDASRPDELVLDPALGLRLTMRGVGFTYPGTLFGVMAFTRQALEDARHQAQVVAAHERDPRGAPVPTWDPDYDALRLALDKEMPVFISADTEEEIRRALHLADEHGLRIMIVGGGEAWKVAPLLRSKRVPVLVSLDFPKPQRWKPADAAKEEATDTLEEGLVGQEPLDAATLREKQRFERLYANAGRLAEAGVVFALTSGGGKADLREGTRKAMDHGLSEAAAVAALTATPASLLEAPYLARLEASMPANLVVASGPLFDKDTKVLFTLVEGVLTAGETGRKAGAEEPAVQVDGTWSVEVDAGEAMRMTMTLEQEGALVTGSIVGPMGTLSLSNGVVSGNELSFDLDVPGMGRVSLTASVRGDSMDGTGRAEGETFRWSAKRSGPGGGR